MSKLYKEIPPFYDEEAARKKLRQELAAYAHGAWSGWMKYMFKHKDCAVLLEADGRVNFKILKLLYDRWIYQMNTPYTDLPEEMKRSNRDEADKILRIVNAS